MFCLAENCHKCTRSHYPWFFSHEHLKFQNYLMLTLMIWLRREFNLNCFLLVCTLCPTWKSYATSTQRSVFTFMSFWFTSMVSMIPWAGEDTLQTLSRVRPVPQTQRDGTCFSHKTELLWNTLNSPNRSQNSGHYSHLLRDPICT